MSIERSIVIGHCEVPTSAAVTAAVCQDPKLDHIEAVNIDTALILSACRNLLIIDLYGNFRSSYLSVLGCCVTLWNQPKAHDLAAMVHEYTE